MDESAGSSGLVGEAELRCGVYAACGGCPLMPQGYRAQCTAKLERFEAAWRAAGLKLEAPIEWHDAPNWVRYRNRVRSKVSAGGELEFFNPAKSPDCAVLSSSVLDGLARLRAFFEGDPRALSGVSHLEVRARDALGRWGVRAVLRSGAALSRAAFARLGNEWLASIEPGGPGEVPCQRWSVAEGCYVEVPLDAFMQINSAVNRELVAHVVSGMLQRGVRCFADLFMGAGNFALPLLCAGLTGFGVERHAGAVAAARRSALAQQLTGYVFQADDALSRALMWSQGGMQVEAVLCDPPRAGLGPRAALAAQLASRWVVLCSCEPRTLCADVARLEREGFAIESVSAFDMFPQTRHLEAVVWLEREALSPRRSARCEL